jgi:SOS response regulatory protein OraA/RecX
MTLDLLAGFGALAASLAGLVVSASRLVASSRAKQNLAARMHDDPELRKQLAHGGIADGASMDTQTLQRLTAIIEKEAGTLPASEMKQIIPALYQRDLVARMRFVLSLLRQAELLPR